MDPQHLMDPVPLMTHFTPRETSLATKCPTCRQPLSCTDPANRIWSCQNDHRFSEIALVDLMS
jgi:hypothetical protein